MVRAKKSSKQTSTIFQATRTPFPVRRPSGGVAQGDARQDAKRGTKDGAAEVGTSHRDGPRSGTGTRESGRVADRPGCREPFFFDSAGGAETRSVSTLGKRPDH
ncbi:hypothetical protein GFK97_12230 [Pseudomonas stutzeri]|nr:hypothetical protein [Stutzerimonas stutzeri]